MKIAIDTDAQALVVDGRSLSLNSDEAFVILSDLWVKSGWNQKYSYTFSWLGVPLIQLPEDIIRYQEVVWRLQPDVIIETGENRPQLHADHHKAPVASPLHAHARASVPLCLAVTGAWSIAALAGRYRPSQRSGGASCRTGSRSRRPCSERDRRYRRGDQRSAVSGHVVGRGATM